MKKLLTLFVCVVGSCFGQMSVDKAFVGVWNLDGAKTKIVGTLPPVKSSNVFINENGFVWANQSPASEILQAGAIAIVRGECYSVGTIPTSCTADTTNPKRPVFNTKSSAGVTVKTEAELEGETMKVKQTVTLPGSAPAVVDLVYTKVPQPAAPPAPAKK